MNEGFIQFHQQANQPHKAIKVHYAIYYFIFLWILLIIIFIITFLE